ncbi:hypothetical protein C2845_PM11G06000 [Panicum miliaceum]|uniref:Transposase (putative) gypsy type domain-containing protein n=1 Tax=Panicum miliaceum TaxID=4540 RepID=A0A3L6RRS8_PANMI|nr:hypothetical protein C2845_PM11G06000 [Panicum miliaceum]
MQGLLQSEEMVQWRPSFRQFYPQEDVDQTVLFEHFIERGLALPASNFFRGLLCHWGIQVHHMNPNSIVHLSIFVQFCEAFLGIEPHFDLFCYFFLLRQQPSEGRHYLVGRAGIQFKKGKGKEYIYYSLPTNHSGWRSLWFYIGNHSPALPERTLGKAVHRPEWNERLNPNHMMQVTELLQLIKEHKDAGLTGVSVLATMYKRRIMPLQKRC